MAVRVSQNMAEVLADSGPSFARASQVMVEVLHSLDAFKPSGGTTGKWFQELEWCENDCETMGV